MKKLIFLFVLSIICYSAHSQTATATITYSGFQACGGCTVCGADYWCTNTLGSYCGDTPPCITRTFFDPVPAGNMVTNITINYWTASCLGASINGMLNGFTVPVAYDDSTGCLCDDLPCTLTTSVTANYPCGLPGYVYGGNNSFQLCSSTDMCINRAEFIISYYPTEVVIPYITPAGPITICPGTSQILTANSGFSAYHWSTGSTSQSITVSSAGTYTVTVTGVTGCTTNTASVLVTVADNVTPAITCPGNITVNNTSGLCSAVVNYTPPSGTDNCPGATTVQIAGLGSGATYPVGTTTNSFRVTDVTGKTANCSFTVTVNDNQNPTITCPSNMTVNNTSGLCGAIVNFTTPVGTDNCQGSTTTQTAGLASGATFPVGTTTNTFRVTDATGKTSTCSFTVTVYDNQAPAITCPSDITVNNTTGLCGAAVTYTAPTGTDNCTGIVTTVQTAGLASGSSFPAGTTTNTFRVTDASGNTKNCSFTVTVHDNQAPSITCPSNITVNSTPGVCGAVVSYTAPTGTDNCPGATTTQTAGLASGSTFPAGTTTNTFKVTDASGNTNICSFTVTVNSGHSISGKTTYKGRAYNGSPAPNPPTYNPAMYNIDRVIVLLRNYPSGTLLARDTSDASGNYQFSNVPDGDYLLSYDKYTADTMQWGNDINVADVSMLKYLIASDTLQDPSRCFSSKYRKAGNVDNNLSLNVIDVSRIKAKIASPYLVEKNFPKGNWVALDKAVTVSGSDVNMNLETICCGDYNASSTKYRDSLYTWNNTKSMEQENIIYTSEENMMLNNASSIELPLSISEKMNEFSALGLELKYPYHEYQLVDVKIPKTHTKNSAVKINPSLDEIIAADDDLLVTDDNGIIRIVYATTKHFDVQARETLIVFRFHSLQAISPGELDFNLTGTGVMANQFGETNDEAYLLMPKIFVQGDDSYSEFELAGYPNPFDGEVEINYSLPESGAVKLNVYNVLGEMVSELVNDIRASGKHTVLFSSKELPAGMYTLRLEFNGNRISRCMVLKLIH